MKALSVVIPSYNSANTLGRCLQSVLGQFQDLTAILIEPEIIVVDSSPEFNLEDWQKSFPTVHFIHSSQRLFAGTARNKGVIHARHDWICFLDSDCIWNDGWLQSAAKLTHDLPNLNGFTGPIYFENLKDQEALAFHIVEFHEFTGKKLNLRFFASGNLLIKKTFLTRIGRFREDIPMCDDFTMTARIDQNELANALYHNALAITHLDHRMTASQLETKAHQMGYWRGRVDSEVSSNLQLKPRWIFKSTLLPIIFFLTIMWRSVRLRSVYIGKICALNRRIFKYARLWALGCQEGLIGTASK